MKYIYISFIILLSAIGFLFFYGNNIYFLKSTTIDYNIFSAYGSFVGGLATFLSILLLIKNINNQSKQFERQSFETNYFNLINCLFNNVNFLNSRYGYVKETGRILLRRIGKELEIGYYLDGSLNNRATKISNINAYINNQPEIDYFIKNVETIFSFITDNVKDNIRGPYYAKIFYNQLIKEEQQIIKKLAELEDYNKIKTLLTQLQITI